MIRPALLALSVAAVPCVACATTLDFSGAACREGAAVVACSNLYEISQTYGDGAHVTVQYDADATTPVLEPLYWWGTGYSSLAGVAIGNNGGLSGGYIAEIVIKPLAGYVVTLTGFQLGAWKNTDPPGSRATQWSITDLGSVFAPVGSGPIAVDKSAPTAVAGSWSSATGISLRFGPDSYNVGIDTITFSVAAVPGPVAGAGLPVLAGFAAWAWRRRRRIVAG